MSHLSKKEKIAFACVFVQKTVPCECLCKKPAFTKRGLLKKKFKQIPPLSFEQPALLDMQKDLFIWGIIKPPVKKFDPLTGVVTFATTPVKRAHYSVLRNRELPPFEFVQQDIYLAGTSARVKLLEEHPNISLCGLGDAVLWIPNNLICSKPIQTQPPVQNAKLIGTLHLHGFIPLTAYDTGTGIVLRLPGQMSKPNTWVNAEAVYMCVSRPELVKYKETTKEAYMLDRKDRLATLRTVI